MREKRRQAKKRKNEKLLHRLSSSSFDDIFSFGITAGIQFIAYNFYEMRKKNENEFIQTSGAVSTQYNKNIICSSATESVETESYTLIYISYECEWHGLCKADFYHLNSQFSLDFFLTPRTASLFLSIVP